MNFAPAGPLSQICGKASDLFGIAARREVSNHRHGSGEFSPVISLSGSKAVISVILVMI